MNCGNFFSSVEIRYPSREKYGGSKVDRLLKPRTWKASAKRPARGSCLSQLEPELLFFC